MKKIIYNTDHPAPFIDRIVEELEKYMIVECWYFLKHTNSKNWRTYSPQDLHLYSDVNIIRRCIHFSKYDLVILRWGTVNNIITGLLLYLFRTPFCFYLDHPDPCVSKTGVVSRLLKKLLFRIATAILPASYSCCDYLHNMYALPYKRMHIFPYSHSLPSKTIERINMERCAKLREGDKVRVLIASRFIERKGYSTVYETFSLLKNEQLLDYLLITIVGNGEQFKLYKSKFLDLNKSIQMLGWVENADYERLLDSTDVYLHPSYFEPFGIPPLDAMERNKMVLVTDGVKSTDVFANHEGIAIYPKYDSFFLAKILKELISNSAQIYDKTKSNRDLVQKYYSLRVNVNSINDIISVP